MTPQTRTELLNLVDALCDGGASVADVVRLQELVLADPECRRLYVQAMELHGLLHWDAAGIGSVDPLVKAPGPAARSARHRRRTLLSRGAVAAACATVVLIIGIFLWRPAQHPMAVNETPVSPPTISEETTQPARAPEEMTPIPEIRLSVSEGSSLSEEAVLSADEPIPDIPSTTPNPLDAATDAAVVAFINDQLREGWRESEVQPSPPAGDEQWVRRVYLDLTGRIPTPTEAEAFFAESAADKRAQLVRKLQGQPEFARHLATVWTNLLVGRSRDTVIDRQKLMAWLEGQFGRNRPWRETVTELVTARGAGAQNGPANFLLAHLNNEAVPATAITARILLCEQLQCTQCHQHPDVKEWGQDRFWQLNAFFQQVKVRERSAGVDPGSGKRKMVRELVDSPKFGPTYYETLQGVMLVAYPRFAGVEFTTDPPQRLREQLAELLFRQDEPQLARAFVNRVWALLMGQGFTIPIDDMGPHHPPSHPELLDGLAKAFVQSGYNVQRLVRWICLSEAYGLSSAVTPDNAIDAPSAGERPLFSRMYVKPLSAEQLFDSLMVAAGEPVAVRGEGAQRRAREREKWLKQFFQAVDTEENGESTTLDGTLPQALMMMNGELISRATRPETGKRLESILSSTVSENEKIRQLSLAALSRYPTSDELGRLRQVVRHQVRQRTERQIPAPLAVNEALRDLYWVFLNTSEFSVIQ